MSSASLICSSVSPHPWAPPPYRMGVQPSQGQAGGGTTDLSGYLCGLGVAARELGGGFKSP